MSNIVVSSRIRLARNISGLPFPHKLNDERADAVLKDVLAAVEDYDHFSVYSMKQISAVEAGILMEKHLISDDLTRNKQYASAIINDAEQISIMINEEDHVRLQCIVGGLNLESAYSMINDVDNLVGAKVSYAFDSRLGYLTSCITNVGTGMRASALMFLPGLGLTNGIERSINAASNFKINIRGVYGEGSRSEGYLYQISNQRTLGQSEADIIASVQNTIEHITEAENNAREYLYKHSETKLRDQVGRACGILQNAYVLTAREFMELIALVKLGAHFDMVKLNDAERLDRLVVDCQPWNISALCGNDQPEKRDIFRAKFVAKEIKKLL